MLPRSYSEQDIRKWQIDTLKIFNDHVIEIKENYEYRIEFVAAGKNMSLDVLLTPEFPHDTPVIFINPRIPHPWVAENSNQIIGAPGLLNYTVHSDLGRVVQAIIREIQKNGYNLANYIENTHSPLNLTVPTPQAIEFPELNGLSIEELQEIHDNTDLQDRILDKNVNLMELEIEIEQTLTNIEGISSENIDKQKTLDDMKSEVSERLSTIVQMKMEYDELCKKHEKLCQVYDPRNIRERLKEAAIKADEEAEAIAEEFLLGNIPVDIFIKTFSEKRALGQHRKTREDRLSYQLEQLDLAK